MLRHNLYNLLHNPYPGIGIFEAASRGGSGCKGERWLRSKLSQLGCDVSCFRKLIHTPYRPECRVRPSNPRADCLPDLRERRWYEARERERADEASSRQLPPLELPPNRHWPLHESVQGSQHLPQGDRGEPQQDRHPRLELPKGEDRRSVGRQPFALI